MTKVAILGGGMAGLTAAFDLSDPALDGRFDVTVYTRDWLLGGKGASTRNERVGDRIEEHGLHVWFGFYDNAFELMREVYAEAGTTVEANFIPCTDIVLAEPRDDGPWIMHRYNPPVRTGSTPGDQVEVEYWDAIEQTLGWVVERWASVSKTHSRGIARALGAIVKFVIGIFLRRSSAARDRGVIGDVAVALLAGLGRVSKWIARLTRPFKPVSNQVTKLADGHLRRKTRRLRSGNPRLMASAPHVARRVSARRRAGDLPLGETSHSEAVADLLGNFFEWFQSTWLDPQKEQDDDVRLLRYTIDTVTAVLNGVSKDGVNDDGLAVIDDQDLCDWLRKHNASEETVARAPFIRALYDLAFGFRDGDPDQPDLAAGKGLQACARIAFMYRGNLAYKVRDGLGDAVFAPLHNVLQRRGVEFRFCHEIENLEVADGAVTRITGTKQVPVEPYVPLYKDKWWPSSPRWGLGSDDRGPSEAPPPPKEPLELVAGEHFDQVVLAISGGCLETVCRDVSDAVPRFAEMVANTKTIATQSAQIWLTARLADRYATWNFDGNSVLSAYQRPLSTYAGMEHLLGREGWKTTDDVKDIAYFCGVLKENGAPALTPPERVRNALRFAVPSSEGRAAGEFVDWELLHGSTTGRQRAGEQYYRENTTPPERYVTTHKGTPQYRLWPDESGLANLVLAGDWTRSGIDGGCMEAAVASGRLAGNALTGSTRKVPGTTGWLGSQGLGRNTVTTETGEENVTATYVDYGGLITIPSPYRSENAVLHGFWAKAAQAKLDALCQKVFRGPSQGAIDYRPFGRRVMITWGAIGKVTSLDPAYASRGSVWENQVAIWIPVVRVRRDGDDLQAVNLSWFVPYIWLDNPMSLTSGREVLGFAKTWGTPTFPGDDGSDRCTLKVLALAQQGDRADMHPLLEVDPLDRGFDAGDVLDSLLDVARHAREALGQIDGEPYEPSFALARDFFGDLFARRLNSVFLKQVPDVEGSSVAALQQIVETAYTVRDFSARPLLGRHRLSVHKLYSQPLWDDLGLADQDLDLAYRCEMDFDVHQSRVLWSA